MKKAEERLIASLRASEENNKKTTTTDSKDDSVSVTELDIQINLLMIKYDGTMTIGS